MGSKQSPKKMDRFGHQGALPKLVQDGASSGKAEPAAGTGRFLENSMSGSRQDTSGAAEGPLAEPESGHKFVSGMDESFTEKRSSPSFATPKTVGAAIMRGRALRTEDSNPGLLLKSRGMGSKARADSQSPMLSFRSLLEGAMSASGVQPSTLVQSIGEPGLHGDGLGTRITTSERKFEQMLEVREGERNFALRAHSFSSRSGDTAGDNVPRVSYSSLLQAQMVDDHVEVRTDASSNTARTLHSREEAHPPPRKLQSPVVEGGFLALFNQTTRLLAPAAPPASPRADLVSNGPSVHSSEKLSQAVGEDAPQPGDIVLERDRIDSLRATMVPAAAVPEGGVPGAEVVRLEQSSVVNDSDEDAPDTPLPKEGGGPAVDELRSSDFLSDRVAMDFSEAATIPGSPILARIREEDVSATEDEMSDALLLEELSRALDIDESNFEENVSSAVELPEAAALGSFEATIVQQGVPREEVLVTDPVSTDEEGDVQHLEASDVQHLEASDVQPTEASDVQPMEAFDVQPLEAFDIQPLQASDVQPTEASDVQPTEASDVQPTEASDVQPTEASDVQPLEASDVQLPEELCGFTGSNLRSAFNVPKRDVTDSSEASAVPEIPELTILEKGDLPAGVGRASCVLTDTISGEENAPDFQLREGAPQALVSAGPCPDEVLSNRDVVDLSGTEAGNPSPVLVMKEEDTPQVEVAVADLRENPEEMCDAFASDEPSQAPALHDSRNTDIVMERDSMSSEGAAESYKVPTGTRADVPLSDSLGEEAGIPGDAVVHTEQGEVHLLSFVHSDEQAVDERIQSPSQRSESDKSCDSRDGLIDEGAALVSSCQVDLERTDDGEAHPVDEGTMLEWSCEANLKKKENLDADPGVPREDQSCEVIAARSVVECSPQASPKHTVNQDALLVKEHNVETCVGLMTSSSEDESFESKAVIASMVVVVEKEPGTTSGNPVDSLHTELAKADLDVNHLKLSNDRNVDDPNLNSLAEDGPNVNVVEKLSPVQPSSNGHSLSVQHQFTPDRWGSVSPCAEGRSEPLDAGSVVGSSWQALPNHTEDGEGVVGREHDGRTEILEDLAGQHTGATEEYQMGGDQGNGPQSSFVGSGETASLTASPHVNGSFLVAECLLTDGGDHTLSRSEEKVEQELLRAGPESSNEVIRRQEVEEHNFETLVEKLTDKQIAVQPISDSRAENQDLNASKSSHESEELAPLRLAVVEPDTRIEQDRTPGEMVNIVTDSGNSGVPADQTISISPGALSDGQRQMILSDATLSESLESVQVSGAEFGAPHQEAGKEVQSPLLMKSKDRDSREGHDPENRRVGHPDDAEENEEQPYASSLNGTGNDQLVGAEVRSFKKKGRPRIYNNEKAPSGAGRPQLQSSGIKRKRHLQYAGNRWRRNRHIDPDQPVPIYIEGRDEGFEEADEGAYLRWLVHQDKGNSAPSSVVRKRIRKYGSESIKPVIAVPSFRVVPDYEARMLEVEATRKAEMQQQQLVPATPGTSKAVRRSDYDMDDDDDRWLLAWNKRLARGGLKQPVTEDKFEEMIEYFERKYAQMEVAEAGGSPSLSDWQNSPAQTGPGGALPRTSPSGLGYLSINPDTPETVTGNPNEGSLLKSLKPPAEERPSDDCCICNGGEDDATNPVYTCKRCSIHVHQSCYGIREKFRDDEGRVIAPPSWCCRKCEAVAIGTAQPNVSCVLCRKKGGALKPTVSPRKWAHVACALYTNETFFVDPDAMEPIDGIAAVAARAQERQDRCGLCGVRKGICSLCSVKGCRAPFHISCGVNQGASFELRESKKRVVGVRSFCPRHARTTPVVSTPSTRVREGHFVSSCTTSGATASATVSGSISTASSMDYREGRYEMQDTVCMDGSSLEPAVQVTNVGDPPDNVTSVSAMGMEDAAGRGRLNGLRFTLKRKRDEFSTQLSDEGVSSDVQKKLGNGKGKVTVDKIDTAGKSTWHVVEPPGKKMKKIKFKFGKLSQCRDPECSPTFVQLDNIGSEDPVAEKINEVMPAIGEPSGDTAVVDGDTVFVNGLTEERILKEVKELTIFGEAIKSGVAPLFIMRDAFVYWRAKRVGHKGSLICALNHRQWSKSQGIFNKDASDEGTLNPLALLPSPLSSEKMLEKAKELREQLVRVRSLAQMVVKREKLKYTQALVLQTIATAELDRVESTEGGPRHCVWCPSTKTLLHCTTCPRSFCFNCFKHRKGFGVKGWMAASKATMYSCKYCRELSSNVADLSNNWGPVPEDINTNTNSGLVSIPVITSEPVSTPEFTNEPVFTPAITSERVTTLVITNEPVTASVLASDPVSTPVITNEPVSTPVITSEPFTTPVITSEPVTTPVITSEPVDTGMISTSEVTRKEIPAPAMGRGKGNGNRWTVADNAGPDTSSKPNSELGAGLKKVLSIANDHIEHSSFETTLRRLKILRRKNRDPNQEQTPSAEATAVTPSAELTAVTPSAEATPVTPVNEVEPSPTTTNGGSSDYAITGPALLVYKKNRRLILSASSESPPSAYDFADEEHANPPDRITSPKRLEIGGLERI